MSFPLVGNLLACLAENKERFRTSRNDSVHVFYCRFNKCLRIGFCILLLTSHFLLLTSITGCGRRGDPVLPTYDEKAVQEDKGTDKEQKKEDTGIVPDQKAPVKVETAVVVPDAPTEVAAVHTGKSIVLVWKEVLKQGVKSYRIYRSSGQGHVLIAETVSPAFTDRDIVKDKKYIYKITAVGQSESLPSEEITVLTEGE
ncbi:MAG: hypothetical protein C4581_06720 [Nitrospiraceae bacterium]|nr:MAG: hypothetical protein C4581_06720 [Nitrospiraceae bacterium]